MKIGRLSAFLFAVSLLVVFSMCSSSDTKDEGTSDDEVATASETPEGEGGEGGGSAGSESEGSSSDGSGSSSISEAAKGELNTAMTGFNSVLGGSSMDACKSGQKQSCDCPGGGTVTMGQKMTFADCKNADGTALYSGTVTPSGTSQSGSSLSGTFDKFGSCTGVTFENVAQSPCGGKISGTCAGEAFSCTSGGTTGSCTCS